MRVRSERDLRIDFFRGLALIVIFVDHVPGNILSRFTPKNFGFSNAADIFVLLAGISAALAFFPAISAHGLRGASGRLLRPIAEIYTAHVVVLWVSIALLTIASHAFLRDDFMGHRLPASIAADPWSAATASMALTLQPNYLDILPLYVVLLLSVPLFISLESLHRGAGLAVSIALWATAEITGLNFPSSRSPAGWYFDPLAWQVLFSIGLLAGIALLQGATLPRSRWLIAAAVGYVLFAFVVTTPCQFPTLSHLCQFRIPETDVVHLAPWRIAHILALAYLAAVTIPPGATWLHVHVAQLVVLLGRNSLLVFLAGVILSLLGSIMLVEFGGGWQKQILLNGVGGCLMLAVASWSDRRREGLRSAGPTAVRIRVRVALGEAAIILLLLAVLAGYALLPGSAVAHSILAIVYPAGAVAGN